MASLMPSSWQWSYSCLRDQLDQANCSVQTIIGYLCLSNQLERMICCWTSCRIVSGQTTGIRHEQRNQDGQEKPATRSTEQAEPGTSRGHRQTIADYTQQAVPIETVCSGRTCWTVSEHAKRSGHSGHTAKVFGRWQVMLRASVRRAHAPHGFCAVLFNGRLPEYAHRTQIPDQAATNVGHYSSSGTIHGRLGSIISARSGIHPQWTQTGSRQRLLRYLAGAISASGQGCLSVHRWLGLNTANRWASATRPMGCYHRSCHFSVNLLFVTDSQDACKQLFNDSELSIKPIE